MQQPRPSIVSLESYCHVIPLSTDVHNIPNGRIDIIVGIAAGTANYEEIVLQRRL
jgi:hypothetical protein